MVTLSTFYKSKDWEALRASILYSQSKIICAHCGKEIVKPYEAICHHVEELTEANVNEAEVALNPANIVVVCFDCHNEIHERFGGGTRHVRLVVGAPCSGKTTFVLNAAGKNDIIVDVDRLYAAITKNPLHVKPKRLLGNVLQIRTLLIDMIKTRHGQWANAWIITSKCRPIELRRMAEDINAEVLLVDTDIDVCKQRARERNGMELSLIDEFFKDYEQYYDQIQELAHPR